MRKFLKAFRLVFLSLPRVIFDFFTWIIPYSNHPERYPIEKRYDKARRLVIFLLRNMHFDLSLTGKEFFHVGEPTLFVANHVAALDPLALIAISKQPVSFISKKENEKTFVVGRFIKAIDGLFLDREDAFQAVRLFREAKANMERERISYCIYPEGTRIQDRYSRTTLPFHPGSLKIAYMAQSPIVLFVQFGSFHVLDKKPGSWHPLIMKGLYRLEYADYSSEKSVALTKKLRDDINAALPAIVDQDDEYYALKKGKKKPEKWWRALLEEM